MLRDNPFIYNIRMKLRDFSDSKGNPKRLCALLTECPQLEDKSLGYVIAGGWSAEILTKIPREHDDIDIIPFTNLQPLELFCLKHKIEYCPPKYYSGVPTDVEDIKSNHTIPCFWRHAKKEVYVLSPEFLLASKITGGCMDIFNHYGKVLFSRDNPRNKDYYDVACILKTHDLNPERLRMAFEKAEPKLIRKLLPIEQLIAFTKSLNHRFLGVKERIDLSEFREVYQQVYT